MNTRDGERKKNTHKESAREGLLPFKDAHTHSLGKSGHPPSQPEEKKEKRKGKGDEEHRRKEDVRVILLSGASCSKRDGLDCALRKEDGDEKGASFFCFLFFFLSLSLSLTFFHSFHKSFSFFPSLFRALPHFYQDLFS